MQIIIFMKTFGLNKFYDKEYERFTRNSLFPKEYQI